MRLVNKQHVFLRQEHTSRREYDWKCVDKMFEKEDEEGRVVRRKKGVGGNEHDWREEEGGKGLRRKKENRRKI